ncbi:hypothetical protein [Chryseobacterium limigenitum]|uniref:DinB superfamily protein n=1 Tax=Chryseobacterium limigenitum TaxID=1612149 RepID=A0A1K2ITL9_9FLAO|nr:hypothetical protein [Chryseobacterium limigenitum]SFZ95586.1 hypothetical protein SAMN05216324_11141 [Chryseobacterium limigenitum]
MSNDSEIVKYLIFSNYKVISMNINDISNEESMIFPNGEANCMNWVLGHLIYIRNAFLNVLGEEPVWNNEKFSCYNRGEIPLNRKDEFVSFDELKSYLKSSQNKFETKLNSLESLDSVIINDISGLSLHEIYHSGQLGYIRRMLGKSGAIK